MERKGNIIKHLKRLLLTAGVALTWLTIPAMGEPRTTSADRDHPRRYTQIDPGTLQATTKPDALMAFETLIRFQESGKSFLYASTPPEGTGAFMTEAIFWIAPDGTNHPVSFEHAGRAYESQMNEGEFIVTGGPGILFSKDKLEFEFQIARKGDFRCCPTAGKISGTYKVIGAEHFNPKLGQYSCNFKLVVDRYKRDIASSSEVERFHREE